MKFFVDTANPREETGRLCLHVIVRSEKFKKKASLTEARTDDDETRYFVSTESRLGCDSPLLGRTTFNTPSLQEALIPS